MRSVDVARTALGNTFRSKLRTALTVVAIVIGAFTLTLTSGLGAGVNKYVDNVVAGFGDSSQLFVLNAGASDAEPTEGPAEYDPEAAASSGGMFGPGTGGGVLTDSDIETIEEIDNVSGVDPVVMVSPDYLETADGDQYDLTLDSPANAVGLELEAGEAPGDDGMDLSIPAEWLTIFDTEDAESVIGETVQIGISDVTGEQTSVEAEIVGVTEEALSGIGATPMPSRELNQELSDLSMEGYEGQAEQAYSMAVVDVDDLAANEDSVKSELTDEGLLGMTVEDQIGAVQGVIDAVSWVLSGFGLIALLAASFGIVNTLLMSVQERTREIGLMKALGMSSGKVFGLFSMEAVVIGILGSVIGVVLGLGAGLIGNAWLTGEGGPLSEVAGLTLFAVDPLSLLGITALIIGIAFLAGTLPAARAAKKDPIEALRYE
ncbi:ABC transporter permease [Nesterenkonia halotolerans]|uniref:ABC transport system permease protein n=1 Tax=Nesterenkonia halotolerans TaxID=225325 RepID=A0ABR9J9R8_9MICC|nr:ABC transporter permease [Nesterenkonia halotolerans]MBE1515650.1 putative ABC transport system permease protein [Nesterenkonia halotolerans]